MPKNLRYVGTADVRKLSAADLERLEITNEEDLVFETRKGGVLEVKVDTAKKLMEALPGEFEEIDADEAEQLQMEADGDDSSGEPSDPNANPSDTTDATTGGTTRTGRGSTRKS